MSKILALDNVYKDDLISFIEIIKVELLPVVVSKIDNDKGMIFLNGILTFAGLLQSKVDETKKKDVIKPNNGLSKR